MRTFGNLGPFSLSIVLTLAASGVGCGSSGGTAPSRTPAQNPTSMTSTRSATTQPEAEVYQGFADPTAQRAPGLPTNHTHVPDAEQPWRDYDPRAGAVPPATPLVETTAPPVNSPKPSAAHVEGALNDAQVLTVLVVANEGEVAAAELALKRATAPDVKQFAGMMKAQHSEGAQKARSLEAKAKLPSTPSDLSMSIDSSGTAALKELRAKQGADFDRAYVESQWKAHKDLLTAIDDRLIPSATLGDVKTMLTDTRKHVADHLTKAEEIKNKLEPTASTQPKAR